MYIFEEAYLPKIHCCLSDTQFLLFQRMERRQKREGGRKKKEERGREEGKESGRKRRRKRGLMRKKKGRKK